MTTLILRRSPFCRATIAALMLGLVSLQVYSQVVGGTGAQNQGSTDLSSASLEDLMNIRVTSVSKKEQRLSRAAAAIYLLSQEDIPGQVPRMFPTCFGWFRVLEDIDRIEVIRGPGATIWGTNAVNGVINITTKSSKDTQGILLTTAEVPWNRVSEASVTWVRSESTPPIGPSASISTGEPLRIAPAGRLRMAGE